MIKRERRRSLSNTVIISRMRRLSEETKVSQLSSGERTTRLVLVLTIIGGGWGILINYYLKFFASVFSKNLYPVYVFGVEHVLLLWIGVSLCMVIGNVLFYIWKELNSYDVKASNLSKRIDSANIAFQNIFKSIKVNSFVGVIIFLAFLIFLGFFKQDRIMMWVTYLMIFIVSVAFLSMLIIVFKRKGIKIFKVDNFNKIFTLKSGIRIAAYVFLFIIWSTMGLGIMAPSQSLDVNFRENKLVMTSKNALPKEVAIEFLQTPENGKVLTHSIYLDKNSFFQSYQKVVYYPDKQSDMLYSLRNISKENEMVFQLDQSEEVYYYDVDFSQYMMEGNNEIRISIKSEEIGEKYTVISTPVIHEKGVNKVLRNEFNIK